MARKDTIATATAYLTGRIVGAMSQLHLHAMSIELNANLAPVDAHGPEGGNEVEGRYGALARVAHKLPVDVRDCSKADPCRRLILKAWSALEAMRLAEGAAVVEAIDAIDRECASSLSESSRFERIILRSVVRALRDDADCADGLVEALEEYPGGISHPVTPLLLRFGHWRGRCPGSLSRLSRPLESPPRNRREAVWSVLHLSLESAIEMEQLRPASAARLANEALELSAQFLDTNFVGARLAVGISARVLYEQNQIDAADGLIRDRLVLSRDQGQPEVALVAYVVCARIAAARHQTQFAVLLLSEAESLGEQWGWPRLRAAALAERVRILVEDGKLKEARLCAARLSEFVVWPTHPSIVNQVVRLVSLTDARLGLASDIMPRTEEKLREVIAGGLHRKEFEGVLEAMLLLSCVLHRIGRDEEAKSELLQVIKLAARAGLYRIFLDGGRAVRELLRWLYGMQIASCGVLGELQSYVRHVLAGFPEQPTEKPSARSRHRSGDSLSQRERSIVEFMSHGLSNKQIARRLGIAPETVKTHAKHILLKLAARTRVEAVSRALSLGMF